jgi:hypothetical protein
MIPFKKTKRLVRVKKERRKRRTIFTPEARKIVV